MRVGGAILLLIRKSLSDEAGKERKTIIDVLSRGC